MTLRQPMGSMSALSLGGGQSTIPMLAAAGVAVTVSAAAFTYRAYKNYEEKKHRKKIDDINRLHNKYLSRIVIHNYDEIKGFPAIFKLIEGEDSYKAESLSYTTDQIDDIGKTLPYGSDISLSVYREYVLNAILKLKEYYFDLEDHHDTTGSVISYLLCMLQTKCLNFEGYDYDIAYLHALANFVNAYASLEGRENSRHFSRFNPVYSYMLSAKQALEKHKEKLSLEEMLGELRNFCVNQNNRLIRSFAKLVNKNSNWELLKTATHDELSQGLIRRQYVQYEIKGLILRKDGQQEISKSIFRPWLIALSNYFLETLDPDAGSSSKNMVPPETLFTVPQWDRLRMLRRDKRELNSQQEMELATMESDLKQIQKLFSKAENFITTELDLKTKNKITRFVPITDTEKLIDRSNIIAQFARYIHKLISLQYLATHLLKSTKQLGEIYVKNPAHFRHVFSVLDQLTKRIIEDTDEIKKAFTNIQLDSQNNMQLLEKELFPEEAKAMLGSSSAAISKLSMRINAYREKVIKDKDPNEPTVESVKYEMFNVATVLSDMYHMDNDDELMDIEIEDKQEVQYEDKQEEEYQTVEQVEPPFVAEKTKDVSDVLTSLYDVIAKIEREESLTLTSKNDISLFNAEIKSYRTLLSSLVDLHTKSRALQDEEYKNPNRELKAEKSMRLTTRLSNQALLFLLLPREKRHQAAASFNERMSAELASVDNQFMDEHKSKFMKSMSSVCNLGLFATDSRKKANRVANACVYVKAAVTPA